MIVDVVFLIIFSCMIAYSIRHWYYVHKELGRYKDTFATYPCSDSRHVDSFILTKRQYKVMKKLTSDNVRHVDCPVMYGDAKTMILNTYIDLVMVLLVYLFILNLYIVMFTISFTPFASILVTVAVFLNLWKCRNVVKKLDDIKPKPSYVYFLSSER